MADSKEQKKRTSNLVRLPSELEERLDALAKLSRYKKNELQVAGIELLCALSEAQDHLHIPLPEIVVGLRAILSHQKDPVVIDLADRYAEIRKPGGGGGPQHLRAAEEPDPSRASARRASGR